jgi:hypothetical protein
MGFHYRAHKIIKPNFLPLKLNPNSFQSLANTNTITKVIGYSNARNSTQPELKYFLRKKKENILLHTHRFRVISKL